MSQKRNIFGMISANNSRRNSLNRMGSAGPSIASSLGKISEEGAEKHTNGNVPPLVRFPGIFSARIKSTNEKR